ncbi:MAG: fibronectin type III domain-containing protein, partial [Desulfosalsimonadaceae bacterium]
MNGASDGVTFTPGSTSWIYEGELAIGENHFTVVAMDAASNQSPADTITVTFENTLPDQPQNQFPEDGNVSVNRQPTLRANEFNDSDSDTHRSSQWQIREVSGSYSDPVYDSNEVFTNLNQITIPEGALHWLTTYSWHVRYRDSRGSWSPYSSETSFTTIDDMPPQKVDTLQADGAGNGGTVALDWTGYNEALHGDIDYYRIYFSDAAFDNVSGLEVRETVDENHFTYTVTGLTKGAPYWFAVVAVDQTGNADPSVTGVAVQATPIDVIPPENPTNVKVLETYDDRLVLNWTHSVNTAGDLLGYRIYINSELHDSVLDANQNTFDTSPAISLSSATGYEFKITAIDNNTPPNESTGIIKQTATLLENPTGLIAQPFSGYVKLSWNASSPSNLLKQYAVYYSTTDFSSVAGMTPATKLTGRSTTITGLTNNTSYYFAVTAINISDGENKAVSTATETPVADTQGPTITDLQFQGSVLSDGLSISTSGNITLTSADTAGVSRVEFRLDGALLFSDLKSPYSCYLDLLSLADGSHILEIAAYDTFGNSTAEQRSISTTLSPPPSPVITAPANGYTTNKQEIVVSGTAEKNSVITLYKNDMAIVNTVTADGTGKFSATITIDTGANAVKAKAANRAGSGPFSNTVTVTLDMTIPQTPTHLTAQSKENGQIRLTWQKTSDTNISGYYIYRSSASFSSTGEATKLNPTKLVTSTTYTDLPTADGTYYYRVTAINAPGNESAISDEASAISDSIPPVAGSISYLPQGKYDAGTGAYAPGQVDVVLTVSEKLMATPFLSITPEGGIPIAVALARDTDTQYTGSFTITDSTVSATAWAVFSARDLAGNRGTVINQGESILINTDGPAVTRLVVAPGDPIQNDSQNPVTVTAIFGLNEAVKTGETPDIKWLLSGSGPTESALTLTQIDPPQSGDIQTWQGELTLPANAGSPDAETLSFIYTGRDYLDNTSDSITCKNAFQVYQGDLPPLGLPEDFKGQSLPAGKIKLSWHAVEFAAGYQLYRRGPGESELTAYGDPLSPAAIEFQDAPSADGLYTYAIASIREENNQTSVSGMSEPVSVKSDAVTPPAPVNLALELVPQGIHAAWETPSYNESVTYSLYRSSAATITSIDGLTSLIHGIPQNTKEAIDPAPSKMDHSYVVTAVDEAGNESEPSNSFYLNFSLLPVSSLTLVQAGNNLPLVSWSHPDAGGSIAGYDVYLGAGDNKVKLNPSLLTGTTFTDAGYAQDERVYSVVAVDTNNMESLPRSITLPKVSALLAEGVVVKRGIMNRLDYTVTNNSSAAINNIRLKVKIAAHDHVSAAFNLAAGETLTVPVIVGGYADLPDSADLETIVEITPNAGEIVRIIRTGKISVGQGMLKLSIQNEEFTRGGTGTVRFALENTGDEEIEIVTAKSFGKNDSDEITWFLQDADENIVFARRFRQAGNHNYVVQLSNNQTVARIPAGATFTSDPVDLAVPTDAPDNLTVMLSIAKVHHHLGKDDQVAMQGLNVRHDITLIETTYTGDITSVTPQTSNGDQEITIAGKSVDRLTGDALAGVPLNLIISLNGFERKYTVFTDETGNFTYQFTPQKGEAGQYSVCAVHPDLLDRPVQKQFVVSQVALQYSEFNVRIPWNYEYTVNVKATAGAGTTVNNLRVVFEARDQANGTLPSGIHVIPGDSIPVLGSDGTSTVSFKVWGDKEAPQTSSFIVKLVSDENLAGWDKIKINTFFSEASPVLYFTPDHIETGVKRGESTSETITLENKGVAGMEDVSLSLAMQDGAEPPPWVYLVKPSGVETLDVGEKQEVGIGFSPSETTPEGNYTFILKVTSSNYHPVNIYL